MPAVSVLTLEAMKIQKEKENRTRKSLLYSTEHAVKHL